MSVDRNALNRIAANCIQKIDIANINKTRKARTYDLNTEKEYNDLLSKELTDFKKHFTPTVRKSIDVIVYNKSNNDGIFSGAIAYHYLSEHKDPDKIEMYYIGAGFKHTARILDKLKDKTVIFLDLSYTDEEIKQIEKNVKTCITIDDHKNTSKGLTFSGNGNFAACVYTWKAFYPTKNVPLMVMYIGQSDNKFGQTASFLPLHSVAVGPITFRYSKSPYIKKSEYSDGTLMKKIWKIIEDNDPRFWIFIGSYMKEVEENIKEQIARNAYVDTFQGYKVGVLNFNDPVLTKKVGRQIVSNMNKDREVIKFSVVWGYERGSNGFKVQIIDDHKQTKINLPEMARILGKKGGHPSGGHGHGHTGNFYWLKDRNHDIWDLFEKKILTDADKRRIEK